MRLASPPVRMGCRLESILPDLSSTVYVRRAAIEAAPLKTDCLTSIHYLFAKALNIHIPLTFVGDMPRLLAASGWEFQMIDATEIMAGDLLFLKRKEERRLIVHAALVLSVEKIFHCKRDMGMVIEPLSCVFETYEQKLKEEQLIYIDSRNKELRELHGGYYLKS